MRQKKIKQRSCNAVSVNSVHMDVQFSKQQKISKGYVWFCEECRELTKRINLTNRIEERINLTNMIEEMKKKEE